RFAIGATRGRIVRQLLIESLLLAACGGVIGLALARVGAGALIEFFRDPYNVLTVSAAPNLRVFGFTLALTIVTGVLFGVLPAWQSADLAVGGTLKSESGGVVVGRRAGLRRMLVASQMALSLLLLIGAGLFVRSLHNLATTSTGFNTTQLLTFTVDPRLNGYLLARGTQFRETLIERVRAIPGVTSAAFASNALFMGGSWNSSVTIEGFTPNPG